MRDILAGLGITNNQIDDVLSSLRYQWDTHENGIHPDYQTARRAYFLILAMKQRLLNPENSKPLITANAPDHRSHENNR